MPVLASSADPVEGGSANDYDYVSGDPVNGLDLSGTCGEERANKKSCFGKYYRVKRLKGTLWRRGRHLGGRFISQHDQVRIFGPETVTISKLYYYEHAIKVSGNKIWHYRRRVEVTFVSHMFCGWGSVGCLKGTPWTYEEEVGIRQVGTIEVVERTLPTVPTFHDPLSLGTPW